MTTTRYVGQVETVRNDYAEATMCWITPTRCVIRFQPTYEDNGSFGRNHILYDGGDVDAAEEAWDTACQMVSDADLG